MISTDARQEPSMGFRSLFPGYSPGNSTIITRSYKMGKSGPKPAGRLTVVEPSELKRPNPLPGMSDAARTIWKRIVNVYAPDYFKPQHYDQLRAYCEAAAQHKEAVKMVRDQGVMVTQDNGVIKRNPWALERDACAQTMANLGTKLSINKNATAVSRFKDAEGLRQPKSKREGLLFRK